MELLRALSEKKCLLEGRIHTQLSNALHKIVHDMPSEVISKSPNASQEEAYDLASYRLDLMEHLFTSILTNVSTVDCTYEVDTLNSSNVEPNTAPSAVVQTEANLSIKEGGPVEENVTVPVAISNQETQTVTVSVGVAKEEQTLESTVAQQVATNVPAAEQLSVELLDNQQTQQDSIKTVTVTPGDVKEGPTVENTVQHVVPITTVTNRPQTEELEDVHHDSFDENATLLSATPPSAVVQTEACSNVAIKEGPVEENVTVPVQTQTVTVSAAVATEEQSSSMPATTQVSEPTVNIETTNVRRSSRVSRKRSLSVYSIPEPQAKKNTRQNTRRSAPPAQPTAATRPATVERSRAFPWVCAECGQVFTGSGVLATHVRTHTGEKPYRCNWTGCDFSAGDRSNVARHVRGVHLKLPVTKKEQRELGIVQQRHERDYIIKVEQED